MNACEANLFLRSPAQYEAKFRQWKWNKNLSKREWEQLFWEQEEVQKRGKEARIMFSGSVVTEQSRKRARRWAEPKQDNGK
jgi:hypothetical protein